MFLLTVVLNYVVILGMERVSTLGKRALMLLAVVWNLGLLVYFKYMNFFLENINRLFRTELPMLQVVLPIGISFFTFQILAFTIAVYRGERERPQFLDYLVFITFFPQLIVGPVVKHEELLPQVESSALMVFRPEQLYRGIMLFSVGCAKKILLANTMINFATEFYGGNVSAASVGETWIGVMSYVFAYYFDFSGYIDMARGLGYLFGIELPINFDSPYRAKDFADFWRRWNMTISRFFQETVFENLFHFGDRIFRLIFATLATFLLSGLWHGAGWHYILWGLVNVVLVSLANIRALKDRKPLPAWLAVFLTFMANAVIRVLFDSANTAQAVEVYRRMFAFSEWIHVRTRLAELVSFGRGHVVLCLTLLLSAVICFCLPNSNRISEKTEFTRRDAVFSGALLALSLFFMSQVSTFLYFNF